MPSPLSLLVEGLRFAYPPPKQGDPSAWVLDGLDLSAAAGEWLAVMGASDAGKTTLCLLAAGLAPSLTGGSLEGRVCVAGRDTRRHPPPALSAHVGLVFQEPTAQLFNPTVETELAWGMENIGTPRPEMQKRIDGALSRFGIDSLRHRSPLTLSGGERKRVALAAVLVLEPRVLILDEPMGGLDPLGREEVLFALSDLLRENSITILMTESDPEAVSAFAGRLAVVAGGRVALDEAVRPAMSQVAKLEELGVAAPQMAQLAAALNKHSGQAYDFLTVGEALQALAHWPTKAGGGPPEPCPASALPPQPPSATEATAIDVTGLWFWYESERTPALRGVDLRVAAGEIVALVGANGSGKTTLVKHLNGLLRPKRGSIRILGHDTAGRSIGEMARSVGFLFQSPEQQIFAATALDEVAFGPRNLGLPAAEVTRRASEALGRFDLAGVAQVPPAILGYGLRRRLTLASLAAMEPPILVLDEPTVGLDAAGRDGLVRWLREQQSAGRAILLVTHDMALVAECASRAVVLSQGIVVEEGSPVDVFDHTPLLAGSSLAPPPVVALAQALRARGLGRPCLTVAQLSDALLGMPGQG